MTYNTFPYNSQKYNGPGFVESASTDAFTFDGFGLQNANITVSESNHSTPPSKDIEDSRVPRGNGRIIAGDFFDVKIITLKGHVRASSASALEDLLEEVKRRLNQKNKILQITEANGTIKQWVCTLRSSEKLFEQREGFHVTFCPFTAEFLCVDPFGKDKLFTSAFIPGISANRINQVINNNGSAVADLYTLFSVVSETDLSVFTVTNLKNGQKMQISSGLSAGDVVIIDSETKTVTKNGVAQDYQGSFIELEPGQNNIQLDITSTSHLVEVTYNHKNAYL